MSVSGKSLVFFLFAIFSLQLLAAHPARATGSNEPLQTSGDQSFWDRKHHKVTLIGHAVVRQEGETLKADRIVVNFSTRLLDAKGNCVYITVESILYGDEMHLNIDTHTGVVTGGRVSNNRFTLSAERINKLSADRYQAHWGEYSTCKDCPNSWSLEAEDVDLTFDGYAFMSNATAKIKDAPALWSPYLIVPVKSRRQTGLIFPHFGLTTNYGLTFVQPFFWAISRSADMTIGAGEYSSRGTRLEWQGRYALSQRSVGEADFYDVNDKTFATVRRNRWGLGLTQTEELPYGIDEKLKVSEVSDTYYPIDFPGDVNNNGNLTLSSDMIFNYSTSDVSAYVDMKRLRNIINVNPDPIRRFTDFDPTTVQEYPTGMATTNDRFIFGTPVAAGLSMGLTNFTRSAGPFDFDSTHLAGLPAGATPVYEPGVDPIREATRASITPTLYTTLRPFDIINLVPSATYYGYYYTFHNATPSLNRGYVLLQADMSAQLERIYDTPDPDRPKQKHLIRPLLTYSNIPYLSQDPNHPFLEQIQYAQSQGYSGYNFDDYDIVPIDNSPSQQNYFVPLGNSVSYGFSTQLITRHGKVDDPAPSYKTNVEWDAGQSINLRQFQDSPSTRQPFSRIFSALMTDFGHYTTSTTYYYYPYAFPYTGAMRNVVSTTHTYIFERASHQRILNYDRSASLSFTRNQVSCYMGSCGTLDLSGSLNFSLNDYILPTTYVDYSMVSHALNTAGFNIMFQSPTQCWSLGTGLNYTVQTKTTSFSFNLSLNLTGNGFGGV